MTKLNFSLIIGAVIWLLIGTSLFLRKRLRFRAYVYWFAFISVWILALAVSPTIQSSLSPIHKLIELAPTFLGSAIISILIVRYAEKKKREKLKI